MAFESWREINRIRKNHRDAIYFYANLQERFYTIEEMIFCLMSWIRMIKIY